MSHVQTPVQRASGLPHGVPFSALLQHSSATNTLSSNIRFRWEYQPGSELFVVYTEGRDTSTVGRIALENRGFAVKLTRLFRF